MNGIEFINGLEHTERLWVKLSKNFFGFPEDIYVCSVYVTPERQHITHQQTMYGTFYKLK